LICFWEVGDGVVGPGRAEPAAAMGALSVVVRFVLGQDHPQVSFAENQHPVGDLGWGGEYEPFGIGVRPGASGRDVPVDRCGRQGSSEQATQVGEFLGGWPGD
jgi:hypothetical protein